MFTKPEPKRHVTMRLSNAHIAKLKLLGGVYWLRAMLDKAKVK